MAPTSVILSTDYTLCNKFLMVFIPASINIFATWVLWINLFPYYDARNKKYNTGTCNGINKSSLWINLMTLYQLTDQDGAEPCPNSVSVHNLLRLSNFLHRTDYHDKASRILRVFYERLTKIPIALPEMTAAVFSVQAPPKQVW